MQSPPQLHVVQKTTSPRTGGILQDPQQMPKAIHSSEPYIVCAFLCAPEHVGNGEWDCG